MYFDKSTLTTAGRALLTRATAGSEIVWGRAACFTDTLTDAGAATTTAFNGSCVCDGNAAAAFVVANANTVVTATMDNSDQGCAAGYARSFGLWAKINGDASWTLVLVAYISSEQVAPPSYFPAYAGTGETLLRAVLEFSVVVTNGVVSSIQPSSQQFALASNLQTEINTRAAFDARCVTTHAAGTPNAGEIQTIRGHKMFYDGIGLQNSRGNCGTISGGTLNNYGAIKIEDGVEGEACIWVSSERKVAVEMNEESTFYIRDSCNDVTHLEVFQDSDNKATADWEAFKEFNINVCRGNHSGLAISDEDNQESIMRIFDSSGSNEEGEWICEFNSCTVNINKEGVNVGTITGYQGEMNGSHMRRFVIESDIEDNNAGVSQTGSLECWNMPTDESCLVSLMSRVHLNSAGISAVATATGTELNLSGDNVNISGTMITEGVEPETNGSYSLGTVNKKYYSVWALNGMFGAVTMSGSITRNTNINNADIGSESYPFRDMYAATFIGSFTAKGFIGRSSSSNNVDIGSGMYPFRDIYGETIHGNLSGCIPSPSYVEGPPQKSTPNIGTIFFALLRRIKDVSTGEYITPGQTITTSTTIQDPSANRYIEASFASYDQANNVWRTSQPSSSITLPSGCVCMPLTSGWLNNTTGSYTLALLMRTA